MKDNQWARFTEEFPDWVLSPHEYYLQGNTLLCGYLPDSVNGDSTSFSFPCRTNCLQWREWSKRNKGLCLWSTRLTKLAQQPAHFCFSRPGYCLKKPIVSDSSALPYPLSFSSYTKPQWREILIHPILLNNCRSTKQQLHKITPRNETILPAFFIKDFTLPQRAWSFSIMPSQTCATAASKQENSDSSEVDSILCWQEHHKSPDIRGAQSSSQRNASPYHIVCMDYFCNHVHNNPVS